MRWPPWAYGVVGAGYAMAAGFSAIYAAPWFMGPPEPDLDSMPVVGLQPRTRAAQRGTERTQRAQKGLTSPESGRQERKNGRREELKPDMGRLAAVASAIAQNPALDGHATVPPPVVSRGAAGVSQATVAALDPALAPAMADCMDAGHLRAAAAHAHTAASAETHNEGGAAERDLTDEEVIFKTRMLVKSVAVATCVAGGIMLLNSRLLFGWQRGPRGAYDSDAFQRAFARFLNEKGWERERPHGYDDRSQRAQAFRRENDAFWKEFHAREEQVVHLSVR